MQRCWEMVRHLRRLEDWFSKAEEVTARIEIRTLEKHVHKYQLRGKQL
jgi:hypothetical protein